MTTGVFRYSTWHGVVSTSTRQSSRLDGVVLSVKLRFDDQFSFQCHLWFGRFDCHEIISHFCDGPRLFQSSMSYAPEQTLHREKNGFEAYQGDRCLRWYMLPQCYPILGSVCLESAGSNRIDWVAGRRVPYWSSVDLHYRRHLWDSPKQWWNNVFARFVTFHPAFEELDENKDWNPCFIYFSQTDRLLFHRLQDASFVLSFHRVELINTTDALVGQHQGTCFQRPSRSILEALLLLIRLVNSRHLLEQLWLLDQHWLNRHPSSALPGASFSPHIWERMTFLSLKAMNFRAWLEYASSSPTRITDHQ